MCFIIAVVGLYYCYSVKKKTHESIHVLTLTHTHTHIYTSHRFMVVCLFCCVTAVSFVVVFCIKKEKNVEKLVAK